MRAAAVTEEKGEQSTQKSFCESNFFTLQILKRLIRIIKNTNKLFQDCLFFRYKL